MSSPRASEKGSRKRPKLHDAANPSSVTPDASSSPKPWAALSRSAHPTIQSSRSIYKYERLNHIQEGSYGIVFRARSRSSNPADARDPMSCRLGAPAGAVVAVKKLKLEREMLGFPITSLREIHTLFLSRPHPSVIQLHEVCVGNTLDQIFLVMEFMEHDLKTVLTLLDETKTRFLASEVKALLHQLLSAVKHLHANWIVHRDLKTSNLLLNNRGRLKIADFGLARRFGDPIGGWTPEQKATPDIKSSSGKTGKLEKGGMTDLVVTLWYRAPELLLLDPPDHRHDSTISADDAPLYDEKIDMWSVGCIFCELLLGRPLFNGSREDEQISQIAALLGPPNPIIWPSVVQYPGYIASPHISKSRSARDTEVQIKQKLRSTLEKVDATDCTIDLVFRLLHYDPAKRLSAADALQHDCFTQRPTMAHPDTFPTFPSAAAGEKRAPTHILKTPSVPKREAIGHSSKMDEKYPMEFDL